MHVFIANNQTLFLYVKIGNLQGIYLLTDENVNHETSERAIHNGASESLGSKTAALKEDKMVYEKPGCVACE